MAGSVIWITGLSGAGKTSVAKALVTKLREKGLSAVLLDGDELREVFPGGQRYDQETRLKLALAYGRLCRLLSRQGLNVVCATISMHRDVYAWNRAHIENYVEVLIDADADLRRQRDPRQHYQNARDGALRDFAGLDQAVDWPEDAHIVLRPGPNESIAATTSTLMRSLAETGVSFAEGHGASQSL